jgi:hypothetical protein
MSNNTRRSLNFQERNNKQHKNRMMTLLTIIRKGYNCTEKDYEDIYSYCTNIDGLSNSGFKFQKRLLNASQHSNKDYDISKEWLDCITLIQSYQNLSLTSL